MTIAQYRIARKKPHIRPSFHFQKGKLSYRREHRDFMHFQHHGEKHFRHPLRDATKCQSLDRGCGDREKRCGRKKRCATRVGVVLPIRQELVSV